MEPTPINRMCWVMHFDGSLTKEATGGGIFFTSSSREQLRYVVRLRFQASNNVVTYEDLVNGQRIAMELGIWHLEVQGDSKLVVG
jgi:ribonuclease HI